MAADTWSAAAFAADVAGVASFVAAAKVKLFHGHHYGESTDRRVWAKPA